MDNNVYVLIRIANELLPYEYGVDDTYEIVGVFNDEAQATYVKTGPQIQVDFCKRKAVIPSYTEKLTIIKIPLNEVVNEHIGSSVYAE